MSFIIPECYYYEVYTDTCKTQLFTNLGLVLCGIGFLLFIFFIIHFFWEERRNKDEKEKE